MLCLRIPVSPVSERTSLLGSSGVTTMRDISKPMEVAWTWMGTNLGLPGQILLICASVIVALALFVWVGNRQGAVG
jgi:hypothetical protein